MLLEKKAEHSLCPNSIWVLERAQVDRGGSVKFGVGYRLRHLPTSTYLTVMEDGDAPQLAVSPVDSGAVTRQMLFVLYPLDSDTVALTSATPVQLKHKSTGPLRSTLCQGLMHISSWCAVPLGGGRCMSYPDCFVVVTPERKKVEYVVVTELQEQLKIMYPESQGRKCCKRSLCCVYVLACAIKENYSRHDFCVLGLQFHRKTLLWLWMLVLFAYYLSVSLHCFGAAIVQGGAIINYSVPPLSVAGA